MLLWTFWFLLSNITFFLLNSIGDKFIFWPVLWLLPRIFINLLAWDSDRFYVYFPALRLAKLAYTQILLNLLNASPILNQFSLRYIYTKPAQYKTTYSMFIFFIHAITFLTFFTNTEPPLKIGLMYCKFIILKPAFLCRFEPRTEQEQRWSKVYSWIENCAFWYIWNTPDSTINLCPVFRSLDPL